MNADDESIFPFIVSFELENGDYKKADRFAGYFWSHGLESKVLINPETGQYFVWFSGRTKN